MALKYKVGDRVKIKSLDWYNANKTVHGDIWFDNAVFVGGQSLYCGCELTIRLVINDIYYVSENDYYWTDEMIECKVEEETKPKFKVGDKVILDTHPCIVTDITWRDSLHGFVYTVRGFGFGKMVGERDLIFDTSEEEVDLNPKFGEYSDNEPLDILKTTIEFIKEIGGLPCPEGYVFKDENGNVINAQKIVLEKANTLKTQSNNMETETHRGYCTTEEETTNKSKKVAWFTFWDNDFADKVELDLSNRELIQEDGKWFVVKKKKEYPKTYTECCELLSLGEDGRLYTKGYEASLIQNFQKLLIARDAYWKIAGEEMGLGKPWEPDHSGTFWNRTPIKYVIYNIGTHIVKERKSSPNHILSFPTIEIRDAFYENFKKEIEECKKLL